MSSKPAPRPEILRSQEEAFLQHYRWLIRWALQFTNNDRARAEDLVQEVFAQFAFAHTDLSAVQNLPAYLYTTLRNTHISEVRRAGRSHVQSLSIIEYSVADLALEVSDPHALYQTQEKLQRICQYACLRKQSSRAGSVLILRFFYGYHLSEVGAVLGGTYQAVRQSLRFARNEARLFLDDPHALKFIDRTQAVNIVSPGKVLATEELLATLRLAIFSSRQGECLATGDLRALYQKNLIVEADNLTLAHIVSCPQCLDGANSLLGLPLLGERHPADAWRPNNSPRGGPDATGRTGGAGRDDSSRQPARFSKRESNSAFMLRCRRRARELFEHYPRELCVTVNGHVLGSQSVTSEVSRLRLDITISEPLSFIEVISEENARLLVMIVDAPPAGEPTQIRQVTLSEGRSIEAALRYGHPWPMLEVVYYDPNFLAESQVSISDVDGRWSAHPEEVSLARPVEVESDQWFDPSTLPTTRRRDLIAPESTPLYSIAEVKPRGVRRSALLAKCKHYISKRASRSIGLLPKRRNEESSIVSPIDFRRGLNPIRRPLWGRPGFITVVLSVFLIGALLLLRVSMTPSVTAANLLDRANAAEAALAKDDQATHRVISLEERNPRGEIIKRSRIEIWRDAGRDLSVRRVYDEKGQLIAGEWTRRSNANQKDVSTAILRTIYHRDQRPRLKQSARNSQAAIRNLDLWQLEPSAKEFSSLAQGAGEASVEERAGAHVINYQWGAELRGPGLVKATLILSRADLHATEMTLLVASETTDNGPLPTNPPQNSDPKAEINMGPQTGSPAGLVGNPQFREYRFVEASFERPPLHAVAPAVFELDPELLGNDTATRRHSNMASIPASARPPVPASPPVATPELELEVAYILDQFRTRFGDQISLTRTAEGVLRVQGIVDTEINKEDVLRALAPVRANPAVSLQISTSAEALQQQKRSSADRVIVLDFSGSENAIPVYQELRRYLSREGATQVHQPGPSAQDDRTDHAVRAFAARMVSRSRRMLSHAIELKQLSERFSTPQLSLLTPDARAKWLSMIRDHAAALQREASMLSRDLQPIFFPIENFNDKTEGAVITNDAELALVIRRVYKLVLANDEAIRSAFTASSGAPEALTLKTSRFRVSLASSERLAGSIREAAASSRSELR